MHGPPLVGWLLVVLGAATAAYCLGRARAGAAGERRAARGDALMGLGMAAMAVPVTVLDLRPWGLAALAALFGAAGVRALLPDRARTGRPEAHHVHHAVGAFAMVYMSLAMAAPPGDGPAHAHTGHEPAGTPLLTGLLLVYFAAYVVRTAAGLVPVPAGVVVPGDARPVLGGDEPLALPSALTSACRLSMGIGMLAMLLTM
ncbi:DUF5134 domain-containing protein [Streptomyces mashuensis]|uniref:DUF5134 domain-containing protein n=1 Tax=Streptomyces mashuensis TaxID=33904 RepID=A0A919BA56_9ACTN|nr:DUF5134 domain-containing protein [Streptomyces mashuensis]GHF69957.1 DUF5134 domain-containing protein [Streptomyces mashuensis]